MARTARAVDNRLREIAQRHGRSAAELREVYVQSVKRYAGSGDAHLYGVANAYGHALGNRANLVRAVEAIGLGSAISSGMFDVRDAMFLKGAGGRFIGSRRRGSVSDRLKRGKKVRSSRASSFGRAKDIADRRYARRMTDAEAYRTDPQIDVKRSLGSRQKTDVRPFASNPRLTAKRAIADMERDRADAPDSEKMYNDRQEEVLSEIDRVVQRAAEEGVGTSEDGQSPFPDPDEDDLKILGGAKDTQARYMTKIDPDTGRHVYSDERRALHDRIIDKFFEGRTPPELGDGEKPVAFFMAGGAASGKSSINSPLHFDNLPKKPDGTSPTPDEVKLFLDNEAGDVMTNTIVINPDLIKEEIPEYKELADSGSLYAASGVHEESSDLSKRLQREAMERGFHVVIDGTGDSGEDKMGKKLIDANDNGYDVRVAVVTISTEDAIVRAWGRYENGAAKFEADPENADRPRMVPLGIIAEQHQSVSDYFMRGGKSGDNRLSNGFHGLDFITSGTVYDNSSPPDQPAAPIARFDNGELVILDEFLFDKFLSKREGSKYA